MNRQYYVYIMTNWSNKILYIGVTSNLQWRVFEHKNKLQKGFTFKYNLNKLVYYEEHQYIEDAIMREKQLKGWLRIKKIRLIDSINSDWTDLAQWW
ncbi:MAG: GIY-YIG nuclease family protein [Candidatus Kerfeldbacteria bacterium]